MPELNRSIWVTFQKEGIHQYPQALTDPALADVSYLGYPHRHMFHFKVTIEVFDDDREIEFLQFKKWLTSLYQQDILLLDYQSCEMISDALAEQIYDKYPTRTFTIDVSEDGENGSVTTYRRKQHRDD